MDAEAGRPTTPRRSLIQPPHAAFWRATDPPPTPMAPPPQLQESAEAEAARLEAYTRELEARAAAEAGGSGGGEGAAGGSAGDAAAG